MNRLLIQNERIRSVLEVMPKSVYIAGKKVTVRYKLQKLQILVCMLRICQQIKVYAIESLTNDHFCYCVEEKCFIASTQVQQLCTCHREIQKELASTSGSWSISCWLQKTKPKEKHHSNMPDDDIWWKPWWWKPKWISRILGTSNLDKFYDYWWGDTKPVTRVETEQK